MASICNKLKPLNWGGKKASNPLFFGLIYYFSAVFMFMVAHPRIGLEYNIISSLLSAISDAALLTIPYVFLPRRWRWAVIVPGFIVACTLLINSWYLPYFGDVMPPRNFLMAQTIDHTLIKCSLAVISLRDPFIILPMIFCIIVYVIYRRDISKNPIKWRRKAMLSGVLALLFIVGPAKGFAAIYKSIPASERTLSAAWKQYMMPGTAIFTHFVRHGYTCGYLSYISIDEGIELSRKDIKVITEAGRRPLPPIGTAIAERLRGNRDKNLIFILVESLSSSSLDRRIGDRYITPCLDSLISAPDAVVFKSIYSQVGPGKSSDGQFIYNTGILPLYDMPLVSVASSHHFPSLARELKKKKAIEIIAESRALWFHEDTNRAYGFDSLIDRSMFIDDKIAPDCQGDSTTLSHSRHELSLLPHPFYAMVTTLGMHGPYNAGETPSIFTGGIPAGMGEQEYLHHVHTAIFDAQLRDFLKWLKDTGLYDNSVIVITGDHTPHRIIGEKFEKLPVPLIILNSGITAKSDIAAGQIDFYPTILDVMGRLGSASWRGLGNSLLRPRAIPRDPLQPDSAMAALSRKIILGAPWGKVE